MADGWSQIHPNLFGQKRNEEDCDDGHRKRKIPRQQCCAKAPKARPAETSGVSEREFKLND
jgi:hypothetical protein